jgi:hypothetical protein
LADPPTLELGKPAQNCQHEELDRVVLLTSLLILVFCILAHLQDGVDGLFVALLLFVGGNGVRRGQN